LIRATGKDLILRKVSFLKIPGAVRMFTANRAVITPKVMTFFRQALTSRKVRRMTSPIGSRKRPEPDREQSIGELLTEYLETLDFETLYAESGAAGLEILSKEKPALVLLDMLMPEMSGLECLQKIKAALPETIVVMVTAVYDEKTAKKAVAAGAYEYITKPVDFEMLQENILNRIFE
jgi:CheY-like chemotaxis protein